MSRYDEAAFMPSQPYLRTLFAAGWLEARLRPAAAWHPFPAIADRSAWDGLPPPLRRSVIEAGEAHLAFDWPLLKASQHLAFTRTGVRTVYDEPYHLRRRAVACLALAELAENRGRFLDDLIDGLWLICEESSWVIAAHSRMFQETAPGLPDHGGMPGIDLFAAETGALLAWVRALLLPALDRVHPLVGCRLQSELRRRLLEPYLQRDDLWWMGFVPRENGLNNWTPWCTSNCLAVYLLTETDPQRRLQAVRKAAAGLDRYLALQPEDGGCDEGPAYWNKAGGALFDCLELLYWATGGQFDIFAEPFIRRIAAYLAKVHIYDNYYLNFADGPHRVTIEGDLVVRFGARTGDGRLLALGEAARRKAGTEGWKQMRFLSLTRILPGLFPERAAVEYENVAHIQTPHRRAAQLVNTARLPDALPLRLNPEQGQNAASPYLSSTSNVSVEALRSAPVPIHEWLDGIQVMAAREKAAAGRGLYAAMKGGHNDERHNHNDVGHVMIYANGRPALIDVGVGTYTAETFGPGRYGIWTMQSAFHSVPTINGHMQSPGRAFRVKSAVCRANASESALELDLAGAYSPEAGVAVWQRRLRLCRFSPDGAYAELRERFVFASEAACRFTLHLMTCREPRLREPGRLELLADGRCLVRIAYDPAVLHVWHEPIPLHDAKLRVEWGEALWRIQFAPLNKAREGTVTLRFTAG